MDGVGPVGQHRADDRRDIEVAVLSRGRSDADRFIRHPHVQSVLVGGRVDRNSLDAEFAACADYPDGDRTAICH